MAKKTSTVKLGIFIFLGLLILAISIFLIGDKDALFSTTFEVKTYFKDIQGLRSGASVRLSGIDVGTVSRVEIIGTDSTGSVEVTLKLVDDVRKFIKTDTKATIETEGLVGNKVVVLKIGSANADQIEKGGTIQAKDPLSFSDIIEETQGVMQYTKTMTKDLAEIVSRVNRGEGSIGKLLVDEELYKNANQLTRSADVSLQAITTEFKDLSDIFNKLGEGVGDVVNNVDHVVLQIDSIVTDINKGKGLLGAMINEGTGIDTVVNRSLQNILSITEESKLAASRLAENMEALKHNWLFKNYFEQRGYWDTIEYENRLDAKIDELENKIKELDDRMAKLKSLQTSSK